MSRIRTIKPALFKNEHLAELPLHARYLFIGLFCLADKEGRLEDRPKRIKAETFPYDDVNVDELLAHLHNAGFVSRYEVANVKIIQVINFTKHQRITGSEAATESIYPGNTKEARKKHLGRQERKGIRKGKEGNGDIEADKPPVPPKFIKPDKILLKNYFLELGLNAFSAEKEAALFFDWYEGNGWKVGKAKTSMKDWQATARLWKNRMNEFKNQTNGSHQPSIKQNSRAANTRDFIEAAKADYESVTGGKDNS